VHIVSAMEPCSSHRPWHDKAIHRSFFKPTSGKCLHYYVYFIDEQFGLCSVRVPTWAPVRLQVDFNGHSWLASQLVLERDCQRFLALTRGEWSISGFRAADLRTLIKGLTPGRYSYFLKRLRTHGLIKKVAHTYKYSLTKLGRRVLATALVVREYFVQPTLVRNAL
jgi:hypothetical protein